MLNELSSSFASSDLDEFLLNRIVSKFCLKSEKRKHRVIILQNFETLKIKLANFKD
jgi:hypothetical protein